MSHADLTPKSYHTRCQIIFASRCWLLAVCLCAFAAAVPISIESTRRPDRSAAIAQERIVQAQARYEQNIGLVAQTKAKLKQSERELQASARLTQRPNWSAVMDRVAAQFQGKEMLTGFRLGTVSDNAVRSTLGPLAATVSTDSVWLVLTGVAASNSDVPGLILRLESLGLFDQVVMTGTKRETYAGGPRTAFELACRVP